MRGLGKACAGRPSAAAALPTAPLALAALLALAAPAAGQPSPAPSGGPLPQGAPLPPGYVAFGAPPPPGAAPGMTVRAFAPGAGRTYKVSFRPGDEVMNGLARFAAAQPMAQAQLSGVGGVRSAVLAWYDPRVRAFKRIPVDEKCEISAVTGTVSMDAAGRPNVHLHLVLTRQDGSSVSGHLISAVVDPVLEVFVTDLGPGKDVAVP